MRPNDIGRPENLPSYIDTRVIRVKMETATYYVVRSDIFLGLFVSYEDV